MTQIPASNPYDPPLPIPASLASKAGFSWDELGAMAFIESSGPHFPWVWSGTRRWPSPEDEEEMVRAARTGFLQTPYEQGMSMAELNLRSALCLDQGRLAGSLSRPDYDFTRGQAIASLIYPRPLPLALKISPELEDELSPLAHQEAAALGVDFETRLFQLASEALRAEALSDFSDFLLPLASAAGWAEDKEALIRQRMALFAARAEARALHDASGVASPRPARPGL